MSELRQRYASAGQEHVYAFWDQLSQEQQANLESQLAQISPEEVNVYAKAADAHDEDQANVQPLPEEVTASMIASSADEISAFRAEGFRQIAAGAVAVLLLAGGQGTRLGSSAPKGCYDIGLPSHKSLFQLQAERIAKAASLAGKTAGRPSRIPWYIMTSGPTRAATEQFFKENDHFGLPKQDVIFFEQGILPCLTTDGKIILESADKVAVAPDGNGGVYKALDQAGVLRDLERRGIKHVHMYCVDNSLVKVADPVFIGFAAHRKADVATKVVRKRDPTESVGLIVSKNGAPGVIEYSEISPELASAVDAQDPDLLKLRAANIVNHYYSTDFLLRTPQLAKSLPFHVAKKKIPFADPTTGKTTKSETPNGIKLEQFVFDIFPQVPFSKFASLEVARQDEFSPVKNGPGSKTDSPDTARADLLKEGERWLEEAGAKDAHPIEIAPAISYAGEGLEPFTTKSVGDYLE